MSDNDARFRTLKRIGPAIEAELHDAGVRTWASLAAVLTALIRVRGVATDALRALRDQASEADRASDAAPAADERDGHEPDRDAPAGGMSDDAPPVPDTSPPQGGTEALEHHLVLDAGKALGGRTRTVDLSLATAELDDGFAYDATLVGRIYGAPDEWTTLGRHSGQGRTSPVPLQFAEIDLAPGLHQLRLDLTVTLPTPRDRPAVGLA